MLYFLLTAHPLITPAYHPTTTTTDHLPTI
jgi:hypothetical protein